MEFLDSPILTILFVLFSLVSFVLVYAGIKSRNLVLALYGIAAGVPPMGLKHAGYWAVGGVLAGAAYWISRRV